MSYGTETGRSDYKPAADDLAAAAAGDTPAHDPAAAAAGGTKKPPKQGKPVARKRVLNFDPKKNSHLETHPEAIPLLNELKETQNVIDNNLRKILSTMLDTASANITISLSALTGETDDTRKVYITRTKGPKADAIFLYVDAPCEQNLCAGSVLIMHDFVAALQNLFSKDSSAPVPLVEFFNRPGRTDYDLGFNLPLEWIDLKPAISHIKIFITHEHASDSLDVRTAYPLTQQAYNYSIAIGSPEKTVFKTLQDGTPNAEDLFSAYGLAGTPFMVTTGGDSSSTPGFPAQPIFTRVADLSSALPCTYVEASGKRPLLVKLPAHPYATSKTNPTVTDLGTDQIHDQILTLSPRQWEILSGWKEGDKELLTLYHLTLAIAENVMSCLNFEKCVDKPVLDDLFKALERPVQEASKEMKTIGQRKNDTRGVIDKEEKLETLIAGIKNIVSEHFKGALTENQKILLQDVHALASIYTRLQDYGRADIISAKDEILLLKELCLTPDGLLAAKAPPSSFTFFTGDAADADAAASAPTSP
ncbi:MAG: hypothetical protein NTV32_10625 [Gammaproteobacteria bacterium]|nr:hypothetical protein [Gammaproteobacteria bacterium]